MARFDWYQGSIQRPADDVLECLVGLAPGLSISHARGLQGYAHTAMLGSDETGQVAAVWHGGHHEYPHVVLSGAWAQPGAELIRTDFQFLHTVSRVDVCEDFGDLGAFDRIQPQLVDVAIKHRLKVDTRGDHLVTKEGRTVYLGSPKSAVRLRLYDKAAEMRAGVKDAKLLAQMPDHLARLEAQVRPATRESKALLASCEPVEVLGCSKWMREVWRAVAGLELTPVQVGRGYRQSDDERAYRYLLAQYGGVLRRLHGDLGSWDCVGLQIGADLSC